MDRIERVLSRPVAKPYRSSQILADEIPFLNKDGHVDFGEGDIENPRNWSTARRWYVVVVAVLLVVNATFASSAPSGCLEGIAEEFGVSKVAAGLVITVFLLGYCAGPLIFAPLSEFYGRRYIFYATFISYIAFNFLCAFAPNFGSLLVGRFLSGTFVSAPLSNAPGVMADMLSPQERGNAMALFSCFTFAGPALGPVVAGFLQLKKDWHWCFYVLLILAGLTLILMFTLPETLPSQVLTNKARRIRRLKIPGYENVQSPAEADGKKLSSILKVALTRPWIILFDPISFAVAIYISVTYCLLYMLFSIYPIVFKQMRGWNAGVSELPLIGEVVGAMLGGLCVVADTKYSKHLLEKGRTPTAEDRLRLAMVGGIGMFVCMFWFGWSANYNSIHWSVPTVAGVFLAMSIMLIFVPFLNYLVDTYLMYAASAIAANTVVRSAAGAAAPLFTSQMFAALGVGGGASLIGGVAAILAIIPFAFYRYGHKLRIKSKFAPTPETNTDEKEKSNAAGTRTDEGDVEIESSDSTTLEESLSRSTTDRSKAEDVNHPENQNALGQPRVGSSHFGKEEV